MSEGSLLEVLRLSSSYADEEGGGESRGNRAGDNSSGRSKGAVMHPLVVHPSHSRGGEGPCFDRSALADLILRALLTWVMDHVNLYLKLACGAVGGEAGRDRTERGRGGGAGAVGGKGLLILELGLGVVERKAAHIGAVGEEVLSMLRATARSSASRSAAAGRASWTAAGSKVEDGATSSSLSGEVDPWQQGSEPFGRGWVREGSDAALKLLRGRCVWV